MFKISALWCCSSSATTACFQTGGCVLFVLNLGLKWWLNTLTCHLIRWNLLSTKHFSSTDCCSLVIFSLFGTLNPKDGGDVVKIPVDQQQVKFNVQSHFNPLSAHVWLASNFSKWPMSCLCEQAIERCTLYSGHSVPVLYWSPMLKSNLFHGWCECSWSLDALHSPASWCLSPSELPAALAVSSASRHSGPRI